MNSRKFCFALAVVLILGGFAATVAESQMVKRYEKGEITFKQSGKSYQFKLEHGEMESKDVLELLYRGKGEKKLDILSFKIVIKGFHGAGKYGKANIEELNLIMPQETSFFIEFESDCTINITRADAKGLEGTATCTKLSNGKGGTAPPLTDVKFTALP
jgi:hypothetical protein